MKCTCLPNTIILCRFCFYGDNPPFIKAEDEIVKKARAKVKKQFKKTFKDLACSDCDGGVNGGGNCLCTTCRGTALKSPKKVKEK